MKILILGGSGMLGHRLWLNLKEKHDVWVTIRNNDNLPNIPEFPKDRVIPWQNVLRIDEITETVCKVGPRVVINCIGAVKQSDEGKDPAIAIRVNSLFPHQLASICKWADNARLIHISTDCVFSGKGGGPRGENELADARDLYGLSKLLGEVNEPNCLTLRTSFIGRELRGKLGLLEWFLAQKSGDVTGYNRAIFTGLTTDEFSRVIDEYILPRPSLEGIYHVGGEPITKYELLGLFQHFFGKDGITITKDEEFVCDRGLDTIHFSGRTGYTPPGWPAMIESLAQTFPFYDRVEAANVQD